MAEESGLPYLGDVIDINQFKRGQVNIVVAPCHSGKTTAAIKIFTEHRSLSPEGLFLIDTTAGRDSLLSHQPAQRTPYEIAELLNPFSFASIARQDRFITETYCEFGGRVWQAPESFDHIGLIICDEIHNLIRYLKIEEANNQKEDPDGIFAELGGGHQEYAHALRFLTEKAASDDPKAPLIIVMTATPKLVRRKLDELKTPYAIFDYTGKVCSDKTATTLHYANFSSLIEKLDGRAIIYTPSIRQIQKFKTLADNGQRKIVCLWSVHNTDYPMSKEQLSIRAQILQTERIPDDIDLLFINAAYETSINIRNEDFKTMVIHTGDEDAQIQARGRLRHDIDTLYLYDSNHKHIAEYFPREYCNVPLSSSDRKMIAEKMALTNTKGRPLKWASIAKALLESGVGIARTRDSNCRYQTVLSKNIPA